MKVHQGKLDKSRLGRLLIHRGLITENELDSALAAQRSSGERLGSILTSRGQITQRDLNRVLKHQNRYRNAAAFITMVALPLQPIVTLAASTGGALVPGTGRPTSDSIMGEDSPFQPISDQGLAEISARSGLLDHVDQLSTMVTDAETGEPVEAEPLEGIKLAAHIFVPVLNFLESDLIIEGVHYRDGKTFRVLDEGGIQMNLPERIDSIKMRGIRVSGSRGASIGNVSLSNIRFSPDSWIRVRPRQ